MDLAQYEEIAGVLRGLLIRLDDRLPDKDVRLVAEFIDVGELGLALEQIADALAEDALPLAPDERDAMVALADRMQMGDRVPQVLSFCSEARMGERPGPSGATAPDEQRSATRIPSPREERRS